MSTTAIVITWNRPTFVDQCLEHLMRSNPPVDQVVVVDASPDDRTKAVVGQFPGVDYVSFPGGAGHMTTARNRGLLEARGDVVSFLDDDANVQPGWLRAIAEAFADETVGAVCGRTTNGVPGEEVSGAEPIGRLLPDGRLTSNFAVLTGEPLEIDHGIGANMSFRRSVLAELGGFRDDFPGTALREDTDIFLRVRSLGYRALFVPSATAMHVAAPHVKGKRFDWRYLFWGRHNHALLLARNFGRSSPIYVTWRRLALAESLREPGRSLSRSWFRKAVGLSGIAAGAVTARRKAAAAPLNPRRDDPVGRRIRATLSS